MPQIAEIKEIEGQLWCRVLIDDPAQNQITLWTQEEIAQYKRACVRDFLIDLFDQWKGRL